MVMLRSPVPKTTVKTRWKKTKLVVDVTFPGKKGATPTLTQNYSVDKKGRLLVATSVGMGPGSSSYEDSLLAACTLGESLLLQDARAA